jgi:WD40 repeat protein
MQFLKGHGYNQTVYSVAFSSDGTKLLSNGLDGTVRLWDLATGKDSELVSGNYAAGAVNFSPDGHWLAWWRSKVEVQEVEGPGRFSYSIPGAAAPRYRHLHQAAFSADNRLLFCATIAGYSDEALEVLDRQTETWRRWDGSEGCRALALSPDGRTLASAHRILRPRSHRFSAARRYDHPVLLWDVSTCKVRHRLGGAGEDIGMLAFSPNGEYLAVTSGPTLWVWQVATQASVAQIKIDKRHFKSAAFSPDSRWLATARNDATVRFFSTDRWTEGLSFDWKVGRVVSVAFARDGMRAACGSGKGKIVVWDVDA